MLFGTWQSAAFKNMGHHKLIDLTGKTFRHLTVLSYVKKQRWLCQCSCGKQRQVYSQHLRGGLIYHCGCLRRAKAFRPMESFTCPRCNKNQSKDDFYKRKRLNGKGWTLSIPCKRCRYETRTSEEREAHRYQQQMRMTEKKNLLDRLKSQPCADCARTFPPECMDFDHVRGKKVLPISQLKMWRWDLVVAELAKCELVCSNCHRTRTPTRRNESTMAKKRAKKTVKKAKKFRQPYPTPTLIPTAVALPPGFTDARGDLQPIVNLPGCSVVFITSKAGSRRADHWHRASSHYCLVTKGSIIYSERPVGTKQAPRVTVFHKGQLFFTPANVEHSMFFQEDSEFWTISNDNQRTQAAYEKDLVRLKEPLLHTQSEQVSLPPPEVPADTQAPASA